MAHITVENEKKGLNGSGDGSGSALQREGAIAISRGCKINESTYSTSRCRFGGTRRSREKKKRKVYSAVPPSWDQSPAKSGLIGIKYYNANSSCPVVVIAVDSPSRTVRTYFSRTLRCDKRDKSYAHDTVYTVLSACQRPQNFIQHSPIVS